jgi:photosystem II stability/assembly factor-like uncharacterized protein
MSLRRGWFWVLAGTLAVAISVAGATLSGAAINGKKVTSAPSWLSLFGVAMRPNGNVYVVGSKGLFMVSTDHGKTWDYRVLHERPGNVLFQDRDLYAIQFSPDGNSGWIVGEMGLMMHTADGGKTWKLQKSGITTNLLNLSVVDAQHAYACGAQGLLLSTDDGGAHWKVYKYKTPITFFDVKFLTSDNGWAVGEFEAILHSADGGQTWTLSYGGQTGDYTVGPFFSIAFSDPQHGLVTGLHGDIVVTSDGGKTWTMKSLPQPVATYTSAVESGGHVWLGGAGGRLLGQGAAGKWVVHRPSFNDITALAFSGKMGYAVGLNGTIVQTDNAGEQWQAVK